MGQRQDPSPTPIRSPRRGRLPGVLLALAAILGGTGCGGPPSPGCGTGPAVRFLARVDSVGLNIFQVLPQSEQDSRRRQASALRDAAQKSTRVSVRIQFLVDACSLAPDDPETWLDLAEDLRWFGEDLQT